MRLALPRPILDGYEAVRPGLETLVTLLLLPGALVHGGSRLLAARALGVETESDPLRLPALNGTDAGPFTGLVRVTGDPSPGRRLLVTAAPLVGNTAASVLAFAILERVFPTADLGVGAGLVGAIDAHVSLVRSLPAGEAVPVATGLWFGLAAAAAAPPNRRDAIRSLRAVAGADWAASRPLRLAATGLFLLGVPWGFGFLYRIALGAYGLGGVAFARSLWAFYLAGLLMVAYYLWQIALERRRGLPFAETYPVAVSSLRALRQQMDHVGVVMDGDADYAVSLLTHPLADVREVAARTLRTFAAAAPRSLSERDEQLLGRFEAETDARCRLALLRSLSETARCSPVPDRLAEAAVAALTGGVAAERAQATVLLAHLAGDEPAALRSHVGALIEALDGSLGTAGRNNLALTLWVLAEDHPDAVRRHEESLREQVGTGSEQFDDRIAATLDLIEDGSEE